VGDSKATSRKHKAFRLKKKNRPAESAPRPDYLATGRVKIPSKLLGESDSPA